MSMPDKLGKYTIVRELGRGAMGIVYEGFDPTIERRVALKTIKSDEADPQLAAELRMRFQREAQAAGRLTHANIVGIYEFAEDAGTAFIAMEFVEGRELKDYFEHNERFSAAHITRIMSELLDALEYSHNHGVVHRDIKPSNIILLKDGTVKVADFGIARIESSSMTQTGSVLGTPSYMSPEQFTGQSIDRRSDIFSAGIVLYELLTGERPFTGSFTAIMHKVLKENAPLPSEINVQAPKGFDAVIIKALAKRPDERYQDAGEFRQAIIQAHDAGVATTMLGTTELGSTVRDPNSTTLRQAPGGAAPRSRTLVVAGIILGGTALLGTLGYFAFRPHAAPAMAKAADATPAASPPVPESAAAAGAPVTPAVSANGAIVISALGIADPQDPRYAGDATKLHAGVLEDARRQLIDKAVGLYVERASMDQNYAWLRDRLLSRSREFIQTVLDEQAPVLGTSGLMSAAVRAEVNVRAVQKLLNQMSADERIEFIRNNGDPTIAVEINVHPADASPDAPPAASPVAENILKERARAFGYRVVSDEDAAHRADFRIQGEARFKKLTATLAASGITVEKFVLTSWTVKAVDQVTGEDIYHNTQIPEKRSWNSEEQALSDVGRLISEEFNKGFFLEYFHFPAQAARLQLTGVPDSAAAMLLAEIAALPGVLNTSVGAAGAQATLDVALSGATGSLPDLVMADVLQPLNRKLGKPCFSVTGVESQRVQVAFAAACADVATLGRLGSLPPAALFAAPPLRRQDVIKNPTILSRLTST